MQHFAELRRRILWIAIFFVVFFGVGWFLVPDLQLFLTQPLLNAWPDGKLIYTGLPDGIMIEFSLSTLFALVLTIPFALYQIWAFVAPGLHKKEKQMILPIILISPILFLIGAAFAFYVLFPPTFKYFIQVNQSAPIPNVVMPSVIQYLKLTIQFLKIFGLSFQLPLIMVLLNKLGVLSRKFVIKSRRYAIVIIFIVAAILTPTVDMLSQCLLALPLCALFEIAILFMKKEPKINQ